MCNEHMPEQEHIFDVSTRVESSQTPRWTRFLGDEMTAKTVKSNALGVLESMSTELDALCGEQEQPPEHPQGQFYAVAMKAFSKGFSITGVIPSEKRPRPYEWQKHPFTNEVDMKPYALEHPDDKVGIFLTRGSGKPFVWDIDSEGVLERMERETGRKLPRTYVVQTRPHAKKWKRHVYFIQTEHSVLKFGNKNKNVKDYLAALNDGEFPTAYDLKGIGGGAQVVAEGSLREGNEYYTAESDTAPIPIPDWLVDWLVEDARKSKGEVQKVSHQRKLERAKALAGLATYVDWRAIMRTRISSYAGLQIEPEDREMLCLKQIKKHCGKTIADDPKVRASVHKAAHDPKLETGKLPIVKKYVWTGTSVKVETSRHTKWLEVVEKFPDEISSADAERKVNAVCEYKKNNASHRSALGKVRKETDFEVDKRTNMWTRKKEKAV